MNSKNLHKGQHYTGSWVRGGSSWAEAASVILLMPVQAGFFQSLMPVACRGREHHKEQCAVRGVPRGQGNVARRLPWLEKVHVNFPRAENNMQRHMSKTCRANAVCPLAPATLQRSGEKGQNWSWTLQHELKVPIWAITLAFIPH